MLTVYGYAKCGTCREAVKWLRAQGLAFQEVPIRETPPTREELARALRDAGGERRRLCNTSGADYRALGLGARLADLSETELLTLLAGNGNLIKRPLVIGQTRTWIGFQPELWQETMTTD
jgi:arsenate reductase (glutaredoxin)